MGEIAMEARNDSGGVGTAAATDLVARACDDPEAFAELYRLHYPRVFNYAMRTLMDVPAAEDVVSEVFLKALKGLGRYEKREAGFESWLFRIATNTMMDHFRRRGREPVESSDLGWPMDSAAAKAGPGAGLEQVETYAALHMAISRLKDIYRVTVILHYFEGKPLKEVASITGCTATTAKWRLHRARRQLGRILDKEALNHE